MKSNVNWIFATGLAGMLLAGTLQTSCNQAGAKQDTTQAVKEAPEILPDLLTRNKALIEANPAEWKEINELTGKLFTRIRKDPNDMMSRLKLAEVYMLEARVTGEHPHYYPAAEQVLNNVLVRSAEPEIRFQALSMLASVYLSLHQFERALDAGQQALLLNSSSAQVYGCLIDANVELGNYAKAVEYCDKMVAIRPDLRSYSRVSYLREIHGEEKGAIEAMKMAVQAGYPGLEQTAWARLTLGNLYQTYGEIENAEMQYQTILMERPAYPFATAALADLELKKGNTKEAEALLKSAIAVIPEVSFYEQLAGIYQQTGRQDEAKKLVAEIFEMMEEDEKAGHIMSLERAKAYLHLTGNHELALEEALKEHRKRPGNIDVNSVLAEIYYQKGDMAKASEHLMVARKTNSRSPELMALAGLIDLRSGNAISGKNLLKASLKANPHQSGPIASEAKRKAGNS